MYLDNDLPVEYEPYGELSFCGNAFINTKMPLEVAGHPPILIGSGPEPRVWLSASVGKSQKQWATVVKDNMARYPGVTVLRPKPGTIEIQAAGKSVVRVTATSPTSAEVTALDLRPLGFNIHGDRATLWIGTNQFSRNTISNCRTGIGIGN